MPAVYNTFKSTYFQLLDQPMEEGAGEEAMLVQWMDLTGWTYNGTTGYLDLTITVHYLFMVQVMFSI